MLGICYNSAVVVAMMGALYVEVGGDANARDEKAKQKAAANTTARTRTQSRRFRRRR